MRFSVLFLFLILTCLYLSVAQGTEEVTEQADTTSVRWESTTRAGNHSGGTYENCCLRYVARVRASTKQKVVNYRIQENDGGCYIPAVVFIMRGGKAFCADPSHFWVKRLIKRIDKTKAGEIRK